MPSLLCISFLLCGFNHCYSCCILAIVVWRKNNFIVLNQGWQTFFYAKNSLTLSINIVMCHPYVQRYYSIPGLYETLIESVTLMQ